MKRWILRGIVAGILLVVVLLVALAFSLGAIVKKEMEKIGPQATKVEVRLRGAEVWLVGQRVELTGFFLGNPPEYKMPSAIEVGDVSVRVKAGTFFSDKWVIESIAVKKPVITLEGGLKHNNLTQIEQNLSDYLNGPPKAATTPAASPATNSPPPAKSPESPERKLQVNDLEVSGAQVQVRMGVTGDKTLTVTIPDIHLTDLGTGPEGITPVQVGKRVLDEILKEATKEAAKNAAALGKEALKDAEGEAKKVDVKKIGDRIKGWFHKGD